MGDDLRHAWRGLRRRPGFAAAAIVTLALGVSVNAMVFGTVHALLLKPVPFPEPDRLFVAYRVHPQAPVRGVWSYPQLQAFQRESRAAEYAGITGAMMTLDLGGRPIRVQAESTSANLLSLLGVKPLLGRTFSEDEDQQPGASPVALISHRLWTRSLGGDPAVIGRSLTFNGTPVTVVGVLPEGYQGYFGSVSPSRYIEATDVWLPLARAGIGMYSRDAAEHALEWAHGNFILVLGRMRAQAGAREVATELNTLLSRFYATLPEMEEALPGPILPHAVLVPLSEDRLDPELVRALPLLQGAAVFVLLVALLNLFGLFRARAIGREKDAAVRAVLGAGRFALARALLVESALLGLLGGLAGLGLSLAASRVLQGLRPGPAAPTLLPVGELTAVRLDAHGVALSVALGMAAALVSALGLLWRERRREPADALTAGTPGGLRRWRAWSGPGLWVAAQAGLALVLAVASILLARSFGNILRVHPGFEASGLVVARAMPSSRAAEADEAKTARWLAWLDEVRDHPSVAAAALGQCRPASSGCFGTQLTSGDATRGESVLVNVVSPGFLRTLGAPFQAGRDFDLGDRAGAPGVVLLSESAARLLRARHPLGVRVSLGAFGRDLEVVGVVGDVAYRRLAEPLRPTAYLSALQSPLGQPFLFVRAAGAVSEVLGSRRGASSSTVAGQEAAEVTTMEEVLSDDAAEMRLITVLVLGCGALALALAGVGLHGLLAHEVGRRRTEMGVRLALGATPGALLRLVLRKALGLLAVGLLEGTIASLCLMPLLGGFLVRVGPHDPASLVLAAFAIVVAALVAAWLPAWHAARVDPAEVLRSE